MSHPSVFQVVKIGERVARIRGFVALALASALTLVAARWWPREHEPEEYFRESPRRFSGRPANLLPTEWHPRREDAAPPSQEELEGAWHLEQAVSSEADAERRKAALVARGLLSLNLREQDEAIAHLKTAAGQVDENAEIQSDLALAYLARYESQGSPADLLEALRRSLLAMQRRPEVPAIRFANALILTRLHLRHQAIEAWRSYLELDASSGWAGDAEDELRRLLAPTDGARWEDLRGKIESEGGRPSHRQLEELVEISPLRSRVWAEQDLLGRWASLAAESPEAEDVLAEIHFVGEILATRYRSPMLLEEAGRIEGAREEKDLYRLEALKAGHAAYSRAQQLYESQDLQQAEPLFRRAAATLAGAGSPFRFWAEFYEAVCVYYRDKAEAKERFAGLERALEGLPYDDLRGRVSWLLGTIAVVQEDPETGVARYRQAFEQLDRSLGPSASSFLLTNEAEALGRLGDVDESWRRRIASLGAMQRREDRRRIHGTLVESVQMLMRQDLAELAQPYLLELQANAVAWRNPMAEAEAWIQAARVELDLAPLGQAPAELLQKAQAAVDRVPIGDIHHNLQLAVDAEVGRRLAASNPSEGIARLSEALEGQEKIGFRFERLRLLLARADAYRNLGDRFSAAADLEATIREYEALRSRTGDENLRILAFGQAQQAFDRLLEILVEDGADSARVFEVAERAKARFLLDLRSGDETGSEADPVGAKAFAALDPGIRVVVYAVLPHRLLIWTADRDELRLRQVAIESSHLELLVARFRNEIMLGGGSGALARSARPLAEVLLGPVAGELEGAEQLVFIPDRFLQRVPFMALPRPGEDRLLLEDAPISLAPSASLFLREMADDDPSETMKSVLAVGDPAFDVKAHPGLSRLERASEEARQVAALYPQQLLLEGEDATKAAVLAGLGQFDVFHFAGHAQTDALSIRLSRLLLAPDASGAQGTLSAYELPRRLGRTRLVVLAACHSLDSTSRNREDLFGIASVFLAAGARNVIAGLWNTDDQPTSELMLEVQQRIAGGSAPPEALRQAILARSHLGRKVADWAQFEILTRHPSRERATKWVN